ncbi:MAG: efflux RND transporter permease subunit [Planctomycetota bacterium]|nr:efflux RND transporter permease subunit [Planctomycetota bacterium]
MLNRLIALALRNRLSVALAALLIAAYGIHTALRMPIDVLPDLNRPTVTLMAEAHAMVPEDVERLVTIPIEQMLNGATGVTRVRSASGLGLSVVQVEFGWETDIFRNRQIVQEKLQLAQSKLPPDVQVQMAPISSIMGQVQLIGFQSKSGKTDVNAIRAFVDQHVKPRLLSISGVAQIVSIGGASRQMQVTVSAGKLRAFDVTFEEVADAVRAANLNASGGFMNVGAKGPVITVTGRVEWAEHLAQAVVRPDPIRPVRLGDVARVDFGPAALRTGEAGVNAKPGVISVVFKQPGVDTVDLTDRVNAELAELRATLPEDVAIVEDVFQQAEFIHRAIDNVQDAVRDGAILVVIVLFLFLLNFRTTFITLTAIPLSVAITAIVFSLLGLSINTMTLGGLAVAIGALVDDAIVDVENVFRRLRQNPGANPLAVIFKASSEVRNPILVGTLLVVVVYVPLFCLTGLEGRLFAPIGLAYIISTLASLVVSLTVTPVLCFYLLGGKFALSHREDGWLVRKLKQASGATIAFSMRHPLPILGCLLATVLCGVFVLATRGSEFLPEFNEGSYQANLILPPDTGLETSDAYGKRMEEVLTSIEGVKNVGRRTGRAEGDEHAEGVNTTETIFTIDPASKRSRNEIRDEAQQRLEDEFPGAAVAVEQPLAHLLSHLLSGVNAQVAIKINGPDLEVLRKTASEVENALRPIPGVTALYTQPLVRVDQIVVEPRRERLAAFGLSVKDVSEAVELGGGGEELSRIVSGQVSYPIIVRLEEKDRNSLESLRGLPLRTPEGARIRLSDVADVKISQTPNNINRENVSRRAVVQHNVAGRSLGEVVADVERALEPIKQKLAGMPGYSIRLSGQFEAQAEAQRLLIVLSFVSLAAMFLILFLQFRSVNLSMQVLMSIPMAFVGAVTYIVLSGQTMSVATLVGLISLGGIAARNAILLIDHYLHLMREEGETFSREMIVRAGQERMVPVLMTALCSGIALIPLALAPDEPGRELLYPVATVIIGGLISSTLLDFLVTPGLFWTFGRTDAERLAAAPRRKDAELEAIAAEFEHEHPSDGSVTPKPLQGGMAHG